MSHMAFHTECFIFLNHDMRHLIWLLMQMELEGAKNQEVEELKAALNDMKLQLGETQETKSEEILKLQSALQDMQLEFEELAKDLEMTHDLAAENENLKVRP